jgi:hypothetical protein
MMGKQLVHVLNAAQHLSGVTEGLQCLKWRSMARLCQAVTPWYGMQSAARSTL